MSASVEYEIMVDESATGLEEAVSLRLREGWSLQGGVSVATYETRDRDGFTFTEWTYAQAMTRTAKEPTP